MDPRTKASLLWGVVAALAFLVLLQGYELATAASAAVEVKAGVALVVGAAGAVAAYLAAGWLHAR